jgi:hypothetical protein
MYDEPKVQGVVGPSISALTMTHSLEELKE